MNRAARQKFYNSKYWKQTRKQKITDFPVCECCKAEIATCVHHIRQWEKYLRQGDIEKASELFFNSKLASLCAECHSLIHDYMGYSVEELQFIADNAEKLSLKSKHALKFCKRWKKYYEFEID